MKVGEEEIGLYSDVRPITTGATKGRSRSRRFVVSVIALTLVAILILALGVLKATPNSPSRHATTSGAFDWTISTLDSQSGNGVTPSIAVDSSDNVHIAYYDWTDECLKYATNVGGSWVIETPDSAEMVGAFCSLAVDSNNNVHISYPDSSNLNLKYATNEGGSWANYTLDSSGNVGYASSIAVDSSNHAHIVYFDDTNGELKYATNFPGGLWYFDSLATVSIADANNDTDSLPCSSIALDLFDYVHISYIDVLNDEIMYATNVLGSWTYQSVGRIGWNSTFGVFSETSIAVDSSDNVHIIYNYYGDDTNFDLRYATNAGGSWAIETLDSAGMVDGDRSIALDSNNSVHISYGCRGAYLGYTLKYATNAGGSWAFEAPDNASFLAGYSSIALDSNNNVHIGYYSSAHLKYATNGLAIPEFGTAGVVIITAVTVCLFVALRRTLVSVNRK